MVLCFIIKVIWWGNIKFSVTVQHVKMWGKKKENFISISFHCFWRIHPLFLQQSISGLLPNTDSFCTTPSDLHERRRKEAVSSRGRPCWVRGVYLPLKHCLREDYDLVQTHFLMAFLGLASLQPVLPFEGLSLCPNKTNALQTFRVTSIVDAFFLSTVSSFVAY